MALNSNNRQLPDGLLGVLIEGEGFVCTDDIRDDEDIDDEDKNTPIFNHDSWFDSERCVRCRKIIEKT